MAIKFENVQVKLNEINIISDLNLTLKEGCINAIIGSNGSGKSLIVKLMSGNIKPSQGKIEILNFSIDKNTTELEFKEINKKVAFVHQLPEEHFFSKTVRDELMHTLRRLDYPVSKREKHLLDSLIMVGMNKSLLARDPLTLSSGELRQLALANALILNPKILVLDEPTIGLDIKDKVNLIKVLKIIKRKYSKTIIIFSKDVEFIHQFSDCIYVLSNGNIVMQGDKYEIFQEQKKLEEYHLSIPKIINFELFVQNDKNKKLGYRDEVNDLIKDILRNI